LPSFQITRPVITSNHKVQHYEGQEDNVKKCQSVDRLAL
jgi:hypothetical protein